MKNACNLTHDYWRQAVKPSDTVIDATCGNGRDTLILAELVGPDGTIHACDIQKEAILSAKKLCPHEHIFWHHGCHSTLPDVEASLITYNLGYLPGGDKNITTMTETTLKSLQQAIKQAPLISIVCYPGHAEGVMEQDAVLAWAEQLDPSQWSTLLHQWLNRHNAPSLLLLHRS